MDDTIQCIMLLKDKAIKPRHWRHLNQIIKKQIPCRITDDLYPSETDDIGEKVMPVRCLVLVYRRCRDIQNRIRRYLRKSQIVCIRILYDCWRFNSQASNTGKVLTLIKRKQADSSHLTRNFDFGKRGTSAKGIFTNFSYSTAQIDISE